MSQHKIKAGWNLLAGCVLAGLASAPVFAADTQQPATPAASTNDFQSNTNIDTALAMIDERLSDIA